MSLFVVVEAGSAGVAEDCSWDFCEGDDTLGAVAEAGAGEAGSADGTAEGGSEELADCDTA